MEIHLKYNNMPVDTSVLEESKLAIVSNEEKEFLDLLADILVRDIINQVKTPEYEK